MFKILYCLLFVQNCQAQPLLTSIDGYWRGAVSRDGSIQVMEVTISRQGDSLISSHNLPDLGIYEEPALISAFSDSGFTIKTFMGPFQVIWNNEHNEITGINNNWKPMPLKLHLKKMIPPLPEYVKADIAISMRDAAIKGSLYKPVNKKRFPLVVIAHGADNPTRTNWVYRYYAYLLTRYGYGVFLYDQRGSGASAGKQDANLLDHADDVVKIGKYFSTKAYIHAKKMTIIGESRGAWVAPVAAAKSSYFKTIILIQGSPKRPVDLEYDVIRTSLINQGFGQQQVDSAIAYANLYFRTVNDPALWSELVKTRELIKDRKWASQLPISGKLNDEDMLWWKNNDLNPAPYLKKRSVSILAIYGGADVYVPAKDNSPLMRSLLEISNKDFKVLTIPGLPHSLYFYQSLYGNNFSWPRHFWIWPKRSVEMDATILDWLEKML